MRNFTKNKKLLTALGISCLSFGAAAVLSLAPQTAFAEDALARPTNATVADKADFYMHQGASVRVDTSGIRFLTYVDPDWHAELTENGATVTYFATAKAVGGSVEQAKEIPFTTTLNEDGNYTLCTYINFKNAENSMTNETLAALYAQDFTTSTFAKVVSADKTTTTYYQAYAYEDEDGVVRSMRAVGNEAWLRWTSVEVDGFNKTDVEKYFTVGNRSTEETAYALTNTDKVIFTMPNYSAGATTVTAYVGAEKYTATLNDDSGMYEITDCATTESNLSIFTDDGTNTVYSTKMMEAHELNSDTITDLQSATDGYYILTEDVDLATVLSETDDVWTPTAVFHGTLDGNGHKISNLSNSWLFNNIEGGKICNLVLDEIVMANESGKNNGAISATNLKKDVEVSNVVIKVKTATPNRASVFGYQESGTLTLSNVVVEMPANATILKGLVTSYVGGTQILDKVYGISKGGTLHSTNGDSTPTYYKADGETTPESGVDYFIGDSIADVLDGETILGLDEDFKKVVVKGYGVVEIDENNIDLLETATDGYYILTKDITMTRTDWGKNRTSDGNFTGIFDGCGYTIEDFKNTRTNNFYNGFFPSLGNAIIQNVIFKNGTMGAYNNGFIANKTKSATTPQLRNVFVEVSITSGTGVGGLFAPSDGNVTMENVVLYVKSVADGALTNDASSLLASTYMRYAYVNNFYVVTDSTLKLTPIHSTVTTAFYKLDGTAATLGTDYFTMSVSAAQSLSRDQLQTQLLKDAFDDMLSAVE